MRCGDLAVLVPSRGRPDAIAGLVDRISATMRAATALIVVVDVDDRCAQQYPSVAASGPPMPGLLALEPVAGAAAALNTVAVRYAPAARHLMYLPDWARPVAPGWDVALIDALEAGHGLACGHDCGGVWERGAAGPRHIAMRSQVVAALGYMIPPGLDTRRWPQVWAQWARVSGGMGAAEVIFARDPLIAGRRGTLAAGGDDYETAAGGAVRDAQRLAALAGTWTAAG